MKFNLFEKLRGKENIKYVHGDFSKRYGPWAFNKAYNPYQYAENTPNHKVRFSFDNPALLDNCPYIAKIGVNLDTDVPGKYIGFVYGFDEDVEEMKSWSEKFNFAELISGLDSDGVSKDDSQIFRIK